jgi:ribosomal protein S3
MSQSKAEAIVAQLLTNTAGLRYGVVSVSVKLHEGRVVEVSYTKTEQTRKQESQKDKNK